MVTVAVPASVLFENVAEYEPVGIAVPLSVTEMLSAAGSIASPV